MPFLPPNQQRQSTEGTLSIKPGENKYIATRDREDRATVTGSKPVSVMLWNAV